MVTGVIELLKSHVPVLSLGVLYVFAVLPIAIFWGRAYAIGVSILSMLAFNVLFLPPLYTVTMADSRNWFALAVLLVTAVVVSELAARSRRQAQEAALLARIATSLLERGTVSGELEMIGAEAAQALQVESVRIELGSPAAPAAGVEAHPLLVADRRVGTIFLERPRQGSERTRRRLLPALASLLGVAIDRERLAREAFEAEALRRSDAMKTALLRAVRSPTTSRRVGRYGRSSRSASKPLPSACSPWSSRSRSRSRSSAAPGARRSDSARRWTRSG